MDTNFRCSKCGKVDTYVMQNDVVVKTIRGKQVWKLYCHFCGADMDKAIVVDEEPYNADADKITKKD